MGGKVSASSVSVQTILHTTLTLELISAYDTVTTDINTAKTVYESMVIYGDLSRKIWP